MDFDTLLPTAQDTALSVAQKHLQSAAGSVNGWIDDGTSQGVIATRPVLRQLAAHSIRAGTTQDQWMRYEVSGAGSSVSNLFRSLIGGDSLNHICSVTCAAVLHSWVRIKMRIYGRAFGVSWYWTTGQPTEPFTVVIDGRPYQVETQQLDAYTQEAISAANPFCQWICPDVLDDGPHEIELVFLGDAAASSRTWIMRSVLLDTFAGYQPQRPIDILGPSATATTSWATYGPTSPWDRSNVRIRRVFCYNYSGSAADIFLSDGGTDATCFWSGKAVAAGATAVCDLGPDGAALPLLYIKSSAATSFYVRAQGGTL